MISSPGSSDQTSCGRTASAGGVRRYGSGPGRSGWANASPGSAGSPSIRGRIESREVPWAIRVSSRESSTKTSVSPMVRPTWIDWPPAVSVAPGRAGRRKVSESSAVVNGTAAGNWVWSAIPKAMSARIASVPPPSSPASLASHAVAGIRASAVPAPNPVGIAPVRCASGGGGGERPSRNASSRSLPGSVSSQGSG